ncbi:histidine phosphatase family protein [Rubrivivax rivuli]|nr:histidine phosphatase family protein [Rubrivivax rivuli]
MTFSQTLGIGLLLGSLAGGATAAPDQVIVVRHAERAPEPKDDPALSAEGAERAELLAATLASAQVKTIITTHYRRTRETAAPLARQLGVTPTVLTIRRGDVPAHIEEVLAEVRKATGVVLVVGHSNTVAAIVAGLSSSQPAKLCETTFANLFVVTPGAAGAPALQLKYSKPDQPPEAGCQ